MTNKEIAIALLSEFREKHTFYGKDHERDMNDTFDLAIEALEERPKGEWIEHYDSSDGFTWLTCSRCMFKAYEEDYHYCPNCGARMEAENE